MKHETWLAAAKAISEDSKCVSMKVGCILVKCDRVIATGINGTPSGYTNCCDKFEGWSSDHREWSLKYEIHAELNALIHCTTSTKGSIAYITHSPCFNCLKHLAGAGVVEIHFIEKYRRMTELELVELIEFCTVMNIKLVHYPEDA
tara:strand:- start:6302 stop:6739 length:438 start_codon:yes stop_codon:yes gene_type:complete